MRYGIQLPVQTLTRTLADPWEDTATVADLVTIAQHAESTGLSFVGACDHVAIPDDDYAAHMTTTWYDPVATLSYLAARTNTVDLLSVVWVAAYRHPLVTAKAFGTLDHLSGGRAILGVGAGHVEGEFDALGIDFSSRGRRLDETLAALSGVFDETYVSHHVTYYDYDAVGVGPQPVRGSIPIWVGGSGRTAWRRAGRFADGYIPMGNPLSQYPEIIDTIGGAAADAGRGDAEIAIGYMPGWAHLTGPASDDLPPTVHSGGPEPLADDIRAARAAGADTMHMKFRARSLSEYLDQLDAFADTVLPLVGD
ncbi:MAG: TIGR03619 family F420-dependent LLM class oxidoreductase [Acidimicrobiia bacterium]|nr:TIGR03619 family F420-dependent LLM class oxidoreductase [Acidimicrobiia bacterium]